MILLGAWLILWTVCPSLCIANIPIDVAENVAWGRQFEWGYDKNPYFGAWFSYAVFRHFPPVVAGYVFFMLCQVSALLGLVAVYLIARDMLPNRFQAFLIVPLALLIPFFGQSATEFNDDVLSMSLYGLTALFVYRGVRRNTWSLWLGAGLCAGLALMTKYLAGILLLVLGCVLLFTSEGRKVWKKPWIYCGGVVCLLLVLPNVIWLFRHDFIAVAYALRRANLDSSPTWMDHLVNFLRVWGYFLFWLILPLSALAIFRRDKAVDIAFFDRVWVNLLAWGPVGVSALFALLTGGEVRGAWTTPYFIFVTPALVMWYRPLPEPRRLRFFAGFMISATALLLGVFAWEYLYSRPYLRDGCTFETYPGKRVSDTLTRQWREAFAVPCRYVVGDRRTSCNMCYYSPDHPAAFFDHDVKLSPWIDLAEIRTHGAVFLWRKGEPRYLKQYPDLVMLPEMRYERAVPGWLRRWLSAPPDESIHAAFLPPRP